MIMGDLRSDLLAEIYEAVLKARARRLQRRTVFTVDFVLETVREWRVTL